MKPIKINHSSDNPDFIRGVFNYCDRWCERCAFTERCRCYAHLQERGLHDPAKHNLDSSEFWEHLRQTFQATKDALLQTAAEEGVDLNDPQLHQEYLDHEMKVEELMESHQPLLTSAQDYALFVSDILERADSPVAVADSSDQTATIDEALLPPPESRAALADALEIIAYFHMFISIKLTRALHSWAEDRLETNRDLLELSSDADGSAKVALIAIDRSWMAWATLRQHIELGEEVILEALKELSELRQAVEQVFPAARGFIRPGFDEE